MIVELLDLDSAFAIYSTPADEFGDFWFLSGSGIDLTPLDLGKPGFAVHPYDDKLPSFMLEGIPHPMELFPESAKSTDFEPSPAEASYLESIQSIISIIEKGECEKVVLSRVKRVDIDEIRVKEVLARLKFDNPNALVYLVHHPAVGTWFGASPETLVKKSGENLTTMSLAGTQHNSVEGDWSEKEKQEQQIVTNYILESLKNTGATNVQVNGPETVQAGELKHLCSKIEFKALDIKKVIDKLHPTPAICGSPFEQAKEVISNLERDSRAYYCGYLGPTSNKGDFHLFVNLRCAEILDDHLRMYVGGGITANSNPEDEWNETEHKAQTLLRVL